MIYIKKEVLTETLSLAYNDVKQAIERNDRDDIIHAKGFCYALEKIAIHFGKYTKEDITNIKNPIIGDVSMIPNKKIDLDIPTFLRIK